MSRVRYKLPVFIIFTVLLMILYMLYDVNLQTYKNIKNSNFSLNFNFTPPDTTYKMESFKEIIIHLDFKGAPPKVSYLLDFIPFVRKLGATGLLLEYEDMFPYYGELEDIKALNAYTLSDISAINEVADQNNMTVIPLVQTFGHLEFLLKHDKFKSLREVEKSPQVLCPNKRNMTFIVHEMISQVMKAHPSSRYFHIGCDEVNNVGVCPKCRKIMRKNKWRKDDIYFLHIRNIAAYITRMNPLVRPIAWGNQFTKKNEKIILAHNLPQMIDIMLWNYKPNSDSYPKTTDMNSYARLFGSIWVASSFKGSSGESKIVTPPLYHYSNNKGWMYFAARWKEKINFKGIAITGWQRYHHFSILCELLPVAIPSLALSFQALNKNSEFNFYGLQKSLKCNDNLPVSLAEVRDLQMLSKLKCNFSGFDIYRFAHLLNTKLTEVKDALDIFRTGNLFFYNIIHNFASPLLIKQLTTVDFATHLKDINELGQKIRSALDEVYDADTISEWMMTYVLPSQLRLEAATKIVQDLKADRTWSRRPFTNYEDSVRSIFERICGPLERKGCAFLNIF